MSDSTPCPSCKSPYGYSTGLLMMCPECGNEWSPEELANEQAAAAAGPVVKDSNGNPLHDGDTVVVIKNLPVKGSPQPVKIGTKIKNIRLTDGDHNIDCRIEGFGAMAIKSEFVKKA